MTATSSTVYVFLGARDHVFSAVLAPFACHSLSVKTEHGASTDNVFLQPKLVRPASVRTGRVSLSLPPFPPCGCSLPIDALQAGAELHFLYGIGAWLRRMRQCWPENNRVEALHMRPTAGPAPSRHGNLRNNVSIFLVTG